MITDFLFLLSRGFFSITATGLLFVLYWGRPKAGDGAFHIPFFVLVNLFGIILWLLIEKRYNIRFNGLSRVLQITLSALLVFLSGICIITARKFDQDVFTGFSFLLLFFKK